MNIDAINEFEINGAGSLDPVLADCDQSWGCRVLADWDVPLPQAMPLLADCDATWSLTSGVLADCDATWPLLVNNPVLLDVDALWSLRASDYVLESVAATLGNIDVLTFSLAFEVGNPYAVLQAAMAEPPPFEIGQFVTFDYGESLQVVVERIDRSDAFGETEYQITARSSSARYMSPDYVADFAGFWSRTMASTIAGELAHPVPLSWQAYDWPVLGWGWRGPRADGLRALAESVGAVVVPDGSGVAVVERGHSGRPALTDDELFSRSVETIYRERFGSVPVIIGRGGEVEMTIETEFTDDGFYTGNIARIYPAPVVPITVRRPHPSTFTQRPTIYESEHTERVQFMAGAAKLRKPVSQLVQVNWIDGNLGAVSLIYDGSLQAAVSDYALADIEYRARYYIVQRPPTTNDQLWIVEADQTAEDVVVVWANDGPEAPAQELPMLDGSREGAARFGRAFLADQAVVSQTTAETSATLTPGQGVGSGWVRSVRVTGEFGKLSRQVTIDAA